MVKRNFKDFEGEVPGFVRYGKDPYSRGILLPNAVAAEIEVAEYATEAETKALIAKAKAPTPLPVLGGKPLPKIRIGTDHDLADATTFAQKLLKKAAPPILLSAQFSQDVLVAVLLLTAYKRPECGMDDVLHYPVDPAWDLPLQIVNDLKRADPDLSPKAKVWFNGFGVRLDALGRNGHTLADIFQAVHRHWSGALTKPKRPARSPKPLAPIRAVEIFAPAAIEHAAAAVTDMGQERRDVGVRLLEQARVNQGNRTLPDAAQACKNLAAKKLSFENLAAPIEWLQSRLLLADAMSAQKFRIPPVLLLGSPGIGKTFLARQLADALGVPSEKISAGGAQGAFQLAGSHGTWMSCKPGMVAALLARSESAAPVVVIDEVDKIPDDPRHPFLPVLLDLTDAGTAKEFRDEYFETAMDASRIIFIFTANDASRVPAPLLSRLKVFTILPPEPAQRLRIIEQAMEELRQETKQQIELGAGVAERLAEHINIDLRQLNELITSAFAMALQAGDKVARIPSSNGLDLAAWIPVLRTH